MYASGGRRHGKQGSSEDLAKLTTFAAARAAAARRGFDGVGLALLPEWGVTALDFDNVVDADGKLPPEVEDIVSRTYAEYSPSGRGVRAFVKGDLGDHKSFKNDENPYTYEVFSSKGFVTFTGNPLLSTEVLGLENTIAPVDHRVLALCDKRFGSSRKPEATDPEDAFERSMREQPLGLTANDITDLLAVLDASMGREAWIKVGMAVHHETNGDGFDLWNEWSQDGYQYPGPEALQAQWDSFTRRENSKQPVTMATVKRMAQEARARDGAPPGESIAKAVDRAKASVVDGDPADVSTPEEFKGPYPIFSAGEFSLRPPVPWIIKGLLPKADLGVMFGASGSGKSFIALDLAFAIARGAPWRGRKVSQGRVLYLAAEGGGGVAARIRAYAQHNNLDAGKLPVGIMHSIPNFLNEENVGDVAAAITSARGVDLVIVDTFAQVTSGANENSGEDMGMALRHARAIKDATGAMVLLVHHSGKDAAKGARGWSGIRAAADVELEVYRPDEGDIRVLRTTKQKDGADDLAWGFTLESVQVGVDEDDDPLTSLVVVEAEVPTTPSEPEAEAKETVRSAKGQWEQVVVDAYAAMDKSQAISVQGLLAQALHDTPAPAEGEFDPRQRLIEKALADLSKGARARFMIDRGCVFSMEFPT